MHVHDALYFSLFTSSSNTAVMPNVITHVPKSIFNYAKPVSDIYETGFGFSGFLHLTGETETGFVKPSIPG